MRQWSVDSNVCGPSRGVAISLTSVTPFDRELPRSSAVTAMGSVDSCGLGSVKDIASFPSAPPPIASSSAGVRVGGGSYTAEEETSNTINGVAVRLSRHIPQREGVDMEVASYNLMQSITGPVSTPTLDSASSRVMMGLGIGAGNEGGHNRTPPPPPPVSPSQVASPTGLLGASSSSFRLTPSSSFYASLSETSHVSDDSSHLTSLYNDLLAEKLIGSAEATTRQSASSHGALLPAAATPHSLAYSRDVEDEDEDDGRLGYFTGEAGTGHGVLETGPTLSAPAMTSRSTAGGVAGRVAPRALADPRRCRRGAGRTSHLNGGAGVGLGGGEVLRFVNQTPHPSPTTSFVVPGSAPVTPRPFPSPGRGAHSSPNYSPAPAVSPPTARSRKGEAGDDQRTRGPQRRRQEDHTLAHPAVPPGSPYPVTSTASSQSPSYPPRAAQLYSRHGVLAMPLRLTVTRDGGLGLPSRLHLLRRGEGGRESAARVLPTNPECVLDAPDFPADATQLLHWGANNKLIIGLKSALYVWDAETRASSKVVELQAPPSLQEASSLSGPHPRPNTAAVQIRCVHWVHKCVCIAMSLDNGTTALYDCRTSDFLRHLALPDGLGVNGITVHGPLLAIATNSIDGATRVYDLRIKNALIATYTGAHRGPITALQYCHAEPFYLATGSGEGRVCVWDARRVQSPRYRLGTLHTGPVTALAWNPTRRSRLFSGGADGVLCLVDTHATRVRSAVAAQDDFNRLNDDDDDGDDDVGMEQVEEHEYNHSTGYPYLGEGGAGVVESFNTASATMRNSTQTLWGGSRVERPPPLCPTPAFAARLVTRAVNTLQPISAIVCPTTGGNEIVTSHRGRGQLQLRKISNFHLQGVCPAHGGDGAAVTCMTLAPDNERVCAAQSDETLTFWRVFDSAAKRRTTSSQAAFAAHTAIPEDGSGDYTKRMYERGRGQAVCQGGGEGNGVMSDVNVHCDPVLTALDCQLR